MISAEDARTTYDFGDHYRILPSINEWNKDPRRIGMGKNVADDFVYSSDRNTDWMSIEFLRKWVSLNARHTWGI